MQWIHSMDLYAEWWIPSMDLFPQTFSEALEHRDKTKLQVQVIPLSDEKDIYINIHLAKTLVINKYVSAIGT